MSQVNTEKKKKKTNRTCAGHAYKVAFNSELIRSNNSPTLFFLHICTYNSTQNSHIFYEWAPWSTTSKLWDLQVGLIWQVMHYLCMIQETNGKVLILISSLQNVAVFFFFFYENSKISLNWLLITPVHKYRHLSEEIGPWFLSRGKNKLKMSKCHPGHQEGNPAIIPMLQFSPCYPKFLGQQQ